MSAKVVAVRHIWWHTMAKLPCRELTYDVEIVTASLTNQYFIKKMELRTVS
ncbi:MAG: hypothetical protein JWQ42_717 [Edaphobacter sp.]|nr:hypothetical protein [Edaphobacter sp.]